MTSYVDRVTLHDLAGDVIAAGDVSFAQTLAESPYELIPVQDPSYTPLDLRTYRLRRDRSEAGDGPTTYGLADFVDVLERADQQMRLLVLTGSSATFVVLTDPTITRVVASTAVDRAVPICSDP